MGYGDCTMRYDITSALSVMAPNASFAVIGNTYEGIEWSETNSQTKPTKEEVTAKLNELNNAEPYKLLREERNKLISETDWTQLKDVDLDIIRERNWKNYRQALRDLPSKSNPKLDGSGKLDMSSITWPDKPSS